VKLVGLACVYSGRGISGSYLSREVTFTFPVFLIVIGEWHLRLYISVTTEHNLKLLLALSCVFYYPDPVVLFNGFRCKVGVTRIHSVLDCGKYTLS
jgi:hypothetical protein